MKEVLSTNPQALAVAFMDMASGFLLGMQVRDDAQREELEVAAHSAVQLCAAPVVDPKELDSDESYDESYVASPRRLYAYARVPSRRDLVVVGLARGDANVPLFRAWIRGVAERVGRDS
jgi:hypothetical protein